MASSEESTAARALIISAFVTRFGTALPRPDGGREDGGRHLVSMLQVVIVRIKQKLCHMGHVSKHNYSYRIVESRNNLFVRANRSQPQVFVTFWFIVQLYLGDLIVLGSDGCSSFLSFGSSKMRFPNLVLINCS